MHSTECDCSLYLQKNHCHSVLWCYWLSNSQGIRQFLPVRNLVLSLPHFSGGREKHASDAETVKLNISRKITSTFTMMSDSRITTQTKQTINFTITFGFRFTSLFLQIIPGQARSVASLPKKNLFVWGYTHRTFLVRVKRQFQHKQAISCHRSIKYIV